MPGSGTLPYGNCRGLTMLSVNVGTQASVGANTTVERTLTVFGLDFGFDFIAFVNKPTAQAGLGIAGARVSADDTLAITYVNASGGGVTPTANELYLIAVIRHDLPDRASVPAAIA